MKVIPTLETEPLKRNADPVSTIVEPEKETVDDVNALPILRNAPVEGTNRDVVSPTIVAPVIVPVSVMVLRPRRVAVVAWKLFMVVTEPIEKTSVVEAHDIVLEIKLMARFELAPCNAWLDAVSMLIEQLEIEIVIKLVAVPVLMPVFTRLLLDMQ